MSLLAQAKGGIQKHAQMSMLFGPPGVGKSTFISKIKNNLTADIEDGSKSLDMIRLGSESVGNYAQLVDLVSELLTASPLPYTSFTIDSVTTLEHYINKAVCEENSVKELSEIPFGKGVALAKEKLKDFIALLKQLQNKGVDVWLVAHSQVKKFSDPTLLQQFDRFTVQAAEGFGQEIIRQCDNVYFIKYQIETIVDKQTKKAKGIGDGTRIMHTRFSAAYDAKTRLNLPETLAFDYEEFQRLVESYGPKSSSELIKDIEALLVKLAPHDKDTCDIAKEKLAEAIEQKDSAKLQRIKEKLLGATEKL